MTGLNCGVSRWPAATIAAAPAMSADSNVRNNHTGEVRPLSHKLATKQARGGFAMPRVHTAAFAPLALHPNGSILAMEPALSRKCRF